LREVWGEVPISTDDFETLFSFLDTDKSNSLDWGEFKMVAKQASILNAIQDYIPLAEVERVEWELVDKGNVNLHNKSFKMMERKGSITESELSYQVSDPLARSSAPRAKADWRKRLLNVMERYTGIDFDGDGQLENIMLPCIDPEKTEVHLIILTVEGGHNSGRSRKHAHTSARERDQKRGGAREQESGRDPFIQIRLRCYHHHIKTCA